MPNFNVKVISPRTNADLIVAMHKLRYRVFKERLDWEVAVSGGMELDRYDTGDPVYLGLMESDRTLLGSVRLLPTTGPNMLANTFPILLQGSPAPRDPSIWECSRLCIDTDAAAAAAPGGLRMATHTLVAGIAEWGNRNGVTELVAATDLHIERILRRAGCRVERLGDPIRIGKVVSVACKFEVSDRVVAETRHAGGLGEAAFVEHELVEPGRRSA